MSAASARTKPRLYSSNTLLADGCRARRIQSLLYYAGQDGDGECGHDRGHQRSRGPVGKDAARLER